MAALKFRHFIAGFFGILALCSGPVGAAAAELSDEALLCQSCHEQHGLEMTFQNKESMEAYVDSMAFKASVHAPLGCSACHPDYTADNHQGKVHASREQYSQRAASVCRQCHSDEALKAKPAHAAIMTQAGKAPACTRCHNAHTSLPIAAGKKGADEKGYCLGCHKQALFAVMKNSDRVSLKVESAALNASAHGQLGCSDCHEGFSLKEHPKRDFGSARELAMAGADACKRCHADKLANAPDNIHAAMLSRGNLKAPVCNDCHGSHAVASGRMDKTKAALTCKQCHGVVYEAYANSVHGKALMNERNSDVPVCADCHSAHAIRDPRTLAYREQVHEMCGRCHANEALMKKYGLYPGVVNSYLDDFHGVTVKLYKLQKSKQGAADASMGKALGTCIDCHGVHDITSTRGPGTNLVKERLVKQCRQCHPDATGNYPDALLSHYEPSMKNAPLVFIITWFYRIMIPFMLTGLVLQILLHVWRYRHFRKSKGGTR